MGENANWTQPFRAVELLKPALPLQLTKLENMAAVYDDLDCQLPRSLRRLPPTTDIRVVPRPFAQVADDH